MLRTPMAISSTTVYVPHLFLGLIRHLYWPFYSFLFPEQVSFSYEDGRPVEGKGVGRKIIGRVQETYDSELAGKDLAYDGEKSLFTVGPLPRNKLEFTVVLEDLTSNRFKYFDLC